MGLGTAGLVYRPMCPLTVLGAVVYTKGALHAGTTPTLGLGTLHTTVDACLLIIQHREIRHMRACQLRIELHDLFIACQHLIWCEPRAQHPNHGFHAQHNLTACRVIINENFTALYSSYTEVLGCHQVHRHSNQRLDIGQGGCFYIYLHTYS